MNGLSAIPATFMRGGTSKGLMLLGRDLPADIAAQDRILLAAMGGADPHGRQLDGLGGGLSSLSKACIVDPAAGPDADVAFTFAQVGIRSALVDRRGNCGNMSAAVGPFAVDAGLVRPADGPVTLRLLNRNTGRIVRAHFEVRGGRTVYDGALAIPGVAGTGAPIRLDFADPGGASTGRLLPTGATIDAIDGIAVSMVDAANACLFLPAAAVGLAASETPDEIEADQALMTRLAGLRAAVSVRMGIAASEAEAMAIDTIPYLGLVGVPGPAALLSGDTLAPGAADVSVRFLAGGRVHRAVPLTAALCTAVAAALPGSVVHALATPHAPGAPLRIATPSGVIAAAAVVELRTAGWHAVSGSFLRTARPLFVGHVLVPGDGPA